MMTAKKGEPQKNRSKTICFECRKACGGCSWARDFIPVEGWDATPTEIYIEKAEPLCSYEVRSCPEFCPDIKRDNDWETLRKEAVSISQRKKVAKQAKTKADLAAKERLLRNRIEERQARIRASAERLDTRGCNNLIVAMVKLYSKDWRFPVWRNEIRQWLHSDMCGNLIDMEPETIEKMFDDYDRRKEVRE